jgi:hypothetical protein
MLMTLSVLRAVGAVLAGVAGLALLPASSGAAASIAVTYNDGTPAPRPTVSPMAANLGTNPIVTRDPPDSPPRTVNRPGLSARGLAQAAGIDPGTLSGSSAMRLFQGAGAELRATLSAADVQSGFENPLEGPGYARGSAVFWHYDDSGYGATYRFSQPMSDLGTYVDGVDSYVPHDDGVAFTVDLHLDDPRVLSVGADIPDSGKVDVPVQFAARPAGGAADWSYSWDFGDKEDVLVTSTLQAGHTYSHAGNYLVFVTANDATHAGGVSQPKIIRIDGPDPADPAEPGDPPPGTALGPGSTRRPAGPTTNPAVSPSGSGTSQTNPVTTGPDRSKTAKDVVGKDEAKGERATATGGSANGSGGGRRGGTRAAGDVAGNGAGRGSAGGGRGRAGRNGVSSSGARAGANPRRHTAAGSRIEGRLLSDSGDLIVAPSAGAGQLDAAHRQQIAAAQGRGLSGGWPAWVGGGLLLAALLCGGVALELLPSTRRVVWSERRHGVRRRPTHMRVWA